MTVTGGGWTEISQRFSVHGVELCWDEWGGEAGEVGEAGEAGDRVPLVLCHGFTGSAMDFSLQITGLASRRRVVALDLRGHGHSTKTGSLEGYTIAQLADDLVAFIEMVAGGGPVDLLGHSMGGLVSLTAVLARPDLVRSLILMDTSAWSFLPVDEGVRTLVHDYMTAFDPARGVPTTLSFGGPEEDLITAATPAEWRAVRDASFAGMDAYAIKALGMVLMADGVGSLRDQLPLITCPVTVVVGSHDHPLVDQAPELAVAVADGVLTVIEGAYHSPQLTHGDEWRAAVEGHLARVND